MEGAYFKIYGESLLALGSLAFTADLPHDLPTPEEETEPVAA